MLSARSSGLGGCCFIQDKKVDLIYRFWELFDYENVSIMPKLARVVEQKGVVVTPPMKHVQEEKLSLALFHHHRLEPLERDSRHKRSGYPAFSNPTILDYGPKGNSPRCLLRMVRKLMDESLLNGPIYQKPPRGIEDL